MKKTLSVLGAFALMGNILIAGPYGGGGKKISIIEEPVYEETSCADCFKGSSIDFYGGYAFAEEDSVIFEDGALGGIGLNFFPTDVFGIGLEAFWIDQTSIVHHFNANLILKLPLDGACIAPYLLGGVGAHINSVNQIVGQAGAGFEWILPNTNCVGLFADGRYVFADETENYAIARVGIRKGF